MMSYVLYGALQLPWWGVVIATLIFTQLTIFGVTIFLHRCQAHRSLDLHAIPSHFFRFWLWLTTGQVTKEWVAVHRKHHSFVETENDPHSPQVAGLKKVMWEGAELYRRESQNQETLDRFGQGTPDDWMERNVYTKHSALGIVLMLIADLTLFGVIGLTVWAIQMAWIPFWAAGVVNGVAHYWGYRNFESQDASRNLTPIAFFIGGEELHNNHHTYGTSAKFSVKWWEVDIGWGVIRTLQMIGLAKPKRVPPKAHLEPTKVSVDVDTIKALITNRFQVMAQYSREVIAPVLSEERHRASEAGRAMLKRIRTILIRDVSLVNAEKKEQLNHILASHPTLSTVYQLRLKLQNIWARGTATQKELVESLQEWCRQAEATGIESLREFVKHLKMYVPQPA